MFNVTGGELFMILLVALIVLGPERLPAAAKRVGQMMGQLRDLSEGFKREVAQALDDPDEPIVKPATRPRLTALDGGAPLQDPADRQPTPADAPGEPEVDAGPVEPVDAVAGTTGAPESLDDSVDEPVDEPLDPPPEGTPSVDGAPAGGALS